MILIESCPANTGRSKLAKRPIVTGFNANRKPFFALPKIFSGRHLSEGQFPKLAFTGTTQFASATAAYGSIFKRPRIMKRKLRVSIQDMPILRRDIRDLIQNLQHPYVGYQSFRSVDADMGASTGGICSGQESRL